MTGGPLWTLDRLAGELKASSDGLRALPDEVAPLGEGEVDPLWDQLQARPGTVLGAAARGWYPVVCPNEAEHTTGERGDGSTGYKPSAGGGVFRCLHGHCVELTSADLRDWLFASEVPDIGAFGRDLADALDATMDAAPEGESVRFTAPLGVPPSDSSTAMRLAAHINALNLGPWILPNPVRTQKGGYALRQPVSDARVHAVIQTIGFKARRNMMTWEVEATLDGYEESENSENMIALLVHACQRCGMDAVDRIRHAAGAYADAHRYHPVLDWIDSVEWDGVDRIGAIAATLKMRDPKLSKWRDIVVRRFLIQVYTAMTNWERAVPTDVGYCLVLQGRENIGKSKWVQHGLLPGIWSTGGMTLKMSTGSGSGERDAVRRATMTPIVELGEVNATFRKTDTADLKNFLTTTQDTYRSSYGRSEEKRPRCTAYIATVNPSGFLIDATGERRFWTLGVERCDWQHTIDLQQLWMQVAIVAEDGEQYWLTADEIKLHAEVSQDHQVDSDVQDIMRDLEHRRQGQAQDETWVHASAKELLGHYEIMPREVFRSRVELNARLERCGWSKSAKVNGKQGWWVPAYKGAMTPAQKKGLRLVQDREPEKS